LSAPLKVSPNRVVGMSFEPAKLRVAEQRVRPHKAHGRGSIASDGYGKVKAMTESPAVVS
jgi:hypothetical protein